MGHTTGHPLATVSVVDALIASLRDRVLDGELPAGTTLAENEIAAEYGVSRPTAKSALSTLVQQGLLHREANKPTTVPHLGPADVEDVFFVRAPLELEVVRTLGTQRTAPVRDAERAVADLSALQDTASPSAFAEADLRFHQLLVDAVGSPRLTRLYQAVRGEIHLCMVQTHRTLRRDRIAAEHAAVLEALQTGDVEGAVARMREHLDGARRSLRGDFDDPGR